MVADLIAASGSKDVIMVMVRQHEASVSVLVDGTAKTWAYRNGAIRSVASDLTFVEQGIINPDSFNLNDVGALFRAAAAVSGSDKAQELQIVDRQVVDHATSEVFMSVSTNPESRPVFFNADGTLVPTLDLTTESGITMGLADARGNHTSATSIVIDSAAGVWLDYPGKTSGTIMRRLRTSKLPVSLLVRNEQDKTATFDPRRVDPAVIWHVLDRYKRAGTFKPDDAWSVTIVHNPTSGQVTMRFVVGAERFTTDLLGTEVVP